MNNWREGLQSDYLDHYAQVNQLAMEKGVAARLRAEFELSFLPLLSTRNSSLTVLDLGCGTGTLVEWLDNLDKVAAIGVDSSSSQIQAAKELRPKSDFVCADGLEFLRENPRRFDGIICNDVLEHLPSLDATVELLNAARHALKSGGFFFCRTPNAASLIAAHSLFADLTHIRLYTSNTLAQILRIAGFSDVSIAPIRSSHFTGKVRLWAEYTMHRFIYWVAGRTFESVFTRNVCAIGYEG